MDQDSGEDSQAWSKGSSIELDIGGDMSYQTAPTNTEHNICHLWHTIASHLLLQPKKNQRELLLTISLKNRMVTWPPPKE